MATTDLDAKIQRFERMTEADPDNDLGHLSLGSACLEAGRADEAAASLARAIELNPTLSKAYQLLGKAYDRCGRRAESVDVITRGVTIADEQGDRMPRDAMAEILREWGEPVPTLKEVRETAGLGAPGAESIEGSSEGFMCSRCARPTGKLAKAPFKGPLGDTVFGAVCTTCWREWVAMGTKVINELGLTLSSPAGQEAYDQYMIEFLQLEDR